MHTCASSQTICGRTLRPPPAVPSGPCCPAFVRTHAPASRRRRRLGVRRFLGEIGGARRNGTAKGLHSIGKHPSPTALFMKRAGLWYYQHIKHCWAYYQAITVDHTRNKSTLTSFIWLYIICFVSLIRNTRYIDPQLLKPVQFNSLSSFDGSFRSRDSRVSK